MTGFQIQAVPSDRVQSRSFVVETFVALERKFRVGYKTGNERQQKNRLAS